MSLHLRTLSRLFATLALSVAVGAGCSVTVTAGSPSDGSFGNTGQGGASVSAGQGGRTGTGGSVGSGGTFGTGGASAGGSGGNSGQAIDAGVTDAKATVDAATVDAPRDAPAIDQSDALILVFRDAPLLTDVNLNARAECDQMDRGFAKAVEDAARCNPASATACQKQFVSGSIRCPLCSTFVEDDAAVKALRDRWKALNCEVFYLSPCPVAACVPPIPGKCRPVDAGPGGICVAF